MNSSPFPNSPSILSLRSLSLSIQFSVQFNYGVNIDKIAEFVEDAGRIELQGICGLLVCLQSPRLSPTQDSM